MNFNLRSWSCNSKTHLPCAFPTGYYTIPPDSPRGAIVIISHNEFSISPHFCTLCFSLSFIRLEFIKTISKLPTWAHVRFLLPSLSLSLSSSWAAVAAPTWAPVKVLDGLVSICLQRCNKTSIIMFSTKMYSETAIFTSTCKNNQYTGK